MQICFFFKNPTKAYGHIEAPLVTFSQGSLKTRVKESEELMTQTSS